MSSESCQQMDNPPTTISAEDLTQNTSPNSKPSFTLGQATTLLLPGDY